MMCLRVALLITILLPAAAEAAEKDWIPATVSLTAPGGYVDTWDRPLPCQQGHFTASLAVKNLRFGATWASSVGIAFQNKDEVARFSFATEGQSALLYPNAAHRSGEKLVSDQTSVKGALPKSVMRMDIRWENARRFTVVLNGNKMKAVILQKPGTTFTLLASGLDAIFYQNIVTCGR
jgi:hypothetical protein